MESPADRFLRLPAFRRAYTPTEVRAATFFVDTFFVGTEMISATELRH
jgi:hypothetical protein